jgi:serine/threonine protein kinase
MSHLSAWNFDEGEEIIPGRYAASLLGGGLRYEAYLAWDDRLLTFVVAKLLRPACVGDSHAQASLQRELDALERFRHPNLVRALGACPDGPRPHLVLEVVDGPRLSTLMRRYGVTIEQVLPLGLSIASALHYLSEEDTVHLDVKPRNVVMSQVPKLIDLSIARTFDELTDIVSPVGTDAYMAPEQCDPERFSEIGSPADIWGLGVTLYEAVARRLPFPTDVEIPYPQLTHEPEPLDPRRVPPVLTELIRSCLEPQPGSRPTAAQLAAELEVLVALLPRPRLGLFKAGSRPPRPPLSSMRALSQVA